MNLYEKIKSIAEDKSISIPKLEEKVGLGNGAIGKWQTSTPKVDNLKKVADALGVSIEELI